MLVIAFKPVFIFAAFSVLASFLKFNFLTVNREPRTETEIPAFLVVSDNGIGP